MQFHTPIYIIEEAKLRSNLALIRDVARRADVEIILAFKAFALWRTFPVFREYIHHTTASSINEARLAFEEFGSPAHTYTLGFTGETFPEFLKYSSHITFNSLRQFRLCQPMALAADNKVSLGLRVNPEYSEIETALYNPCAPGSRFGVLAEELPDQLPEGLEGFHCHNHCESSAESLVRSLVHLEAKFGRWFSQLKWLNLGGGHLMTRKDYNVELLVETLKGLRQRYPWLKVILEPGSAFAWQTGPLVASVVDIVENHGIRTAIMNASFTCHMPDCLEMPYMPQVRGARVVEMDTPDSEAHGYVYRLGGDSCLSGDYMGSWVFDHELQIGERLYFEDMNHYTTVKTTMFNGIHHPSIAMQCLNGDLQLLRTYAYEDYRDRMD
ncbi:MAG: carboxynorspermidine decarboxylase [Prevotellaceae bacterium]|nr:carboxynorspermidine decarboxylase [Prevotellaceae bacterium]